MNPLDDRTTISRDDPDPLAKMIWEVFDTGRPMVGKISDDGEFTTEYLDEEPPRLGFADGDRVRKVSNPKSTGTVRDSSVLADLYEVRWDHVRDRLLANNPYAGDELERIP